MGKYIGLEALKIRLAGKVRFTEDPDNQPDRMPVSLANRLISEAEGHVEYDLSPRYEAPFQTDAGLAFDKLPDRPTKETLRTMCELQAVLRVLETDFGSGSAVNAKAYTESLEKRYGKMVERILEKRKEHSQVWKYPPLPCLRLAYFNEAGDTGYTGQVIVTNVTGDGGYPAKQINDPSEDFLNGRLDED